MQMDQDPAAKAINQLNPSSSLRSTLHNAPLTPPEKLQVLAALAGCKNQKGLVRFLGVHEATLSRAINSKGRAGNAIRQRLAALLGVEVADFWRPGKAA